MGIVLCFTLFILIYLNYELKNYWSIVVLLLGITLIFLSGNRASLIVLFLMSVSYLLYIKRGINLKIFSIIAGIFLVSGAIFFLLANYLSFDNYIRFYEFKLFVQNGSIPPTLQVRLDKWQWIPAYMKTIKQGLFGYTTNDFIKDKVYTSPDNQYLNWLVYFGYIGFTCFIVWVFYSLRILLQAKKISKALNVIYISNASLFFVIYWIGLIVIGLFQESFFFGRLRELFVFLFAMITAYSAGHKNISKV
jgi:O-antigen ligase